jgi:hypothetical protein
MAIQGNCPEWWEWELIFTDHLLDRMYEKGFNEADLRTMLADAHTLARAKHPGRWIASTRWDEKPWKVVLEPDTDRNLLVVVTAYAVI